MLVLVVDLSGRGNSGDWYFGEGLGPESVFLSRFYVRIPQVTICVGLVHTELCYVFRWTPVSGYWDWSLGLVGQ